jgi:hypothetical protein
MKPLLFIFLIGFLLNGHLIAQEEEPSDDARRIPEPLEKIKISVAEGKVVSIDERRKALEIANTLMDNSKVDLTEDFDRIETPFIFPQPEIEKQPDQPDVQTPDTTPIITGAPKDDLEVLRLLAPRLQREVQGSMIMGTRKRLIWSNGNSVGIGYTFKTRVDPNDPNEYVISISDIETKSFTIKLNDTEIPIPIGDTSSGGIQAGN